jgi:peptidyl-prolyl cis-trans isomerase SurA
MCARILLSFVFLLPGARAEVIDRIAVTLDNQVITQTEILLAIRLTAFLNGDSLDFSSASRKKAADRLIEQKLIRKEMEPAHYLEAGPAELESMLKEARAQRFHDAEEYRAALENYGITEQDLKAHLRWQVTFLRFIDLRFRPGIHVTDDEIRKYFDQELPELQKKAGNDNTITFNDLRDKLEENLTGQHIDKQVDDWLAQARKRTHIEFHPEAFR